MTMKKSTIWILGVVMGLSFISLLYLQISYIEEMVKMRNEQFDESVKRALMAASKDVESAEVDRWLREDISEAEKKAWEQSSQGKGVVQTQRFTVTSPDGTRYSAIELKTFTNEASELPRAMISRKHGTKTIPQTSRSLADAIKNRYLYQRALLDEVAWQMIYRASSRPIEERVNFKNLDQYLKSGLIDNGIELNYHFKVIDRDGREVYRCSDYSDEGSESSYSQPLFLNDPPARMSIVKIHFPGKRDYIFDSVSFMIPSMIFTFVLLITFIFTIYIVFRQKKLTEMKNDFINNMTHEFKTPISTISLAAQMLKDPAVGKSPAMFQHISGVINDETKRLRFQVEKVLQMSMFDRQKATLKMKELDTNELITGVINTFALKVERYNGLNAGARLDYPLRFARDSRQVSVSGEAWFEVAHDADKPFTVKTFLSDVEVLGTKFNLDADESAGHFSVTLAEGSIRLRGDAGEKLMVPGEKVDIVGGKMTTCSYSPEKAKLWMNGIIDISGLTFLEIMRKLEKSFGVKIVVTLDEMPAIGFSEAELRQSEGVESALKSLQCAGVQFRYSTDFKTGTIYIK